MNHFLRAVPPHIGYYFAGFADGEGSFNISFRRRDDYSTGWKISACFNVSQKERVILALFKRYLKCGTLRVRDDGVWYFEVNNMNALVSNVIPFFNKYHFLSAKKKKDFSKFKQIVNLMQNEECNSTERIIEILKLRSDMNGGGKRKYSEKEIIESLNKESSETICQTDESQMI